MRIVRADQSQPDAIAPVMTFICDASVDGAHRQLELRQGPGGWRDLRFASIASGWTEHDSPVTCREIDALIHVVGNRDSRRDALDFSLFQDVAARQRIEATNRPRLIRLPCFVDQ